MTAFADNFKTGSKAFFEVFSNLVKATYTAVGEAAKEIQIVEEPIQISQFYNSTEDFDYDLKEIYVNQEDASIIRVTGRDAISSGSTVGDTFVFNGRTYFAKKVLEDPRTNNLDKWKVLVADEAGAIFEG